MFNFNAKLLKKIEDEKNNHMQMFQELKNEIHRFKESVQIDYKFFYDEISKLRDASKAHTANNYIKRSEMGSVVKSEVERQKRRSELFERAKKWPKIGGKVISNPVSTENTNEINLPNIKRNGNSFVFVGDSDVYKDLPAFIAPNQFAEILNLSLREFYNYKKRIEKKVPRFKFGLQTYRYQKSDVLRFINYPYEIIDTLAWLKNNVPDQITKYQLCEILCISDSAFTNVQKYIENIILTIRLGHRTLLYNKSDVIKFIERRGLSVA